MGRVIQGRYLLEALIGAGGFGAVYRARHVAMKTTVAIKILHAEHCRDATAVKRFELEATRSASLLHPNSIKVFDFGRTETGEFFLAMEHLDGRSLTSVIRRDGHIDPERTVHILAQVLRALDEAHGKGIVHRDLKPDNIFLLAIGHEQDFVKVLDYGISKARDVPGGLTQIGQIIGTPVYMSPEQVKGLELDGRSDLYAIGCIAFHMLTGRTPFVADDPLTYAIMHVQDAPPDVREVAGELNPVPTRLAAWVHKLLAKEPAERYASAHEALDALSTSLTGPATWDFKPGTRPKGLVREGTPHSVAPTPTTTPAEPLRTGLARHVPVRRRPVAWLWLVGGLAALGVGAAAAVLVATLVADDDLPTTLGDAAPDAAIALAASDSQVAALTVPGADALAAEAAPVTTDAVVEVVADGVVDAVVVDAVADASPDGVVDATEVAPDGAVAVRERSVVVRSRPSGAAVWIGGAAIGATPCEVRWAADEPPPRVELRKVGYVRQTITLRVEDDGRDTTVTLRKKAPEFERVDRGSRPGGR